MTKQDFFSALQDMLQCDEPLTAATELTSMEEWDSLAFMAVIAFFDKNFGQRIVFSDLKKCRTVADVMALAKGIDG